MSQKHITSDQQTELAALLRAGMKQNAIAQLLGRHPSTVSKEIARNSVEGRYFARVAKRRKAARRMNANARFRRIETNGELQRIILMRVLQYWSPEQIAGRLQRMRGKTIVCHETIYQWIYTYHPELTQYFRCRKGKYRRRYGTRKREKEREEGKKRRIDTRPLIVAERARIGDWEGDTIVGGEKTTAIMTHVDRKSGLLVADKLKRLDAASVQQKAEERFKALPAHTITYDNGREFSYYELIGRNTGADIYFAYPYHSWERGCNENANGLLRQFFPKKSPFKNVHQLQIDAAVDLINYRPRKRHHYLTPTEVYQKDCLLG